MKVFNWKVTEVRFKVFMGTCDPIMVFIVLGFEASWLAGLRQHYTGISSLHPEG